MASENVSEAADGWKIFPKPLLTQVQRAHIGRHLFSRRLRLLMW